MNAIHGDQPDPVLGDTWSRLLCVLVSSVAEGADCNLPPASRVALRGLTPAVRQRGRARLPDDGDLISTMRPVAGRGDPSRRGRCRIFSGTFLPHQEAKVRDRAGP